jgi:hypothetical protein
MIAGTRVVGTREGALRTPLRLSSHNRQGWHPSLGKMVYGRKEQAVKHGGLLGRGEGVFKGVC